MTFKTPRGFRDLAPEDALILEHMLDCMQRLFQKFGFDPIQTPVLEKWETLKGKQGAEEHLIFKFTDELSEREYALRYDLTVPLARFFTNSSYSLPFKRYQIGRAYRHDRPQKGRFREFRQADVDIVGSPFPEADAEIINLIQEVLNELGFSKYDLLINDRRILSGIFKEEFDISNPFPLYRIIDKKDKIGIENVKEELHKAIDNKKTVQEIIEILSMNGDEPFALLEEIQSSFSEKRLKKGISHLRRVFELTKRKKNLYFSLSLVRGLEYYTGPVFEVKLKNSDIGSVVAGGRYDNLMRVYGRDASATGASFGIGRLIEAGKDLGIFETDKETRTEVYVVSFGNGKGELYEASWELVFRLRKAGFNVQTDLRRRSVGSQLDYAKSKSIPIVIFLGPKEIKKDKLTIYIEKTEKRLQIEYDKIEQKLEEILNE